MSKKKSTKSSSVKATAKKSTVKKTTASKSVSLGQSFLADEQVEFHRKHPNAYTLITVFIFSFFAFIALYLSQMFNIM
jgi:hypothetical protein